MSRYRYGEVSGAHGVKLRAGQVVRIRVNPTDCLSVLDALEKAGINVRQQGMSFSQCVSLALSSLLMGARQQGWLPEPDGFQYANRMSQFRGFSGHAEKLAITDAITAAGATFQMPGLSTAQVQESSQLERDRQENERALEHALGPNWREKVGTSADRYPTAEPTEPGTREAPVPAEEREARRRLGELAYKKDLVEDGVDGVIWSARDEEEYQRYYKVVYPHG